MSDPTPLNSRCPYCRKQIVQRTPFFPFCSPRCKMADLQRWFAGTNVISQDIESLTPEQREDIEELDEATPAAGEPQ